MHQAKVLDRRHRTGEECGDVNLVLGPERVRGDGARGSRDLRSALRIKVEDANDVRMAEEAVKAGHSFWTKLVGTRITARRRRLRRAGDASKRVRRMRS